MEDENTKAPIASEPVQAQRHTLRRVLAIVSVLLTLVSWGLFCFGATASFVVAIAALVCSVAGVTVGRGCLRDLAITSLIASVVLVIVYSIFYWGIPYAVSSL